MLHDKVSALMVPLLYHDVTKILQVTGCTGFPNILNYLRPIAFRKCIHAPGLIVTLRPLWDGGGAIS